MENEKENTIDVIDRATPEEVPAEVVESNEQGTVTILETESRSDLSAESLPAAGETDLSEDAEDALPVPAEAVEADPVVADAASLVPVTSSASEENVPSIGEDRIELWRQRREGRLARRKRDRKMRFLHVFEGKDIRYRGPLSYRGLRILAWLCIILSQVGLLCSVAVKMDAGFAERFGRVAEILPNFYNLMTPLFLTATFAIILNNSCSFRSLLALYGFFALLVYALFLLVHDRYVVGIAMRLLGSSRAETTQMLDLLLSLFIKNGYVSFNLFIDLFLCTLFTFFVIYRPKRVFVGKRLIIFRFFAILPAAYEIASIVFKALASVGTVMLPVYVYPLLTTKPPMTFLLFVSLTFFIKKREWLYRRNGKSHEEYQRFLGTNLNSLQFSTYIVIQFVVFAVLDMLIMVFLAAGISDRFAYLEDPMTAAIEAVSAWGFGKCGPLILTIPFIMLFSYTRSHKDTRPDIVINIVGVAILFLIYIESLYQVILYELDVVKGAFGF